MKRNYPIRRSIRLLIMVGLSVLLLATAAFAVEDYGTTVKRDPKDHCTVHVILQIGLVDAKPGDVGTIGLLLRIGLGSLNCEIPCVRPPQHCKVDVTIDVKEWTVLEADSGKYHKVWIVGNDDLPSGCYSLGTPNGANASGIWRRGRSRQEYCHEALHLAGLKDKYCGVHTAKYKGKHTEPTCPPGDPNNPCPCQPLTGGGCPAGCAGKGNYRCAKPCKGSENDIMGSPSAPPSRANILAILDLAPAPPGDPPLNTCPEHPCCPGPCDTPLQPLPGSSLPSYYCWGNPSRDGDRFLNERFNMPPDLGGRLDKIEIAFKLTGSTGTPDPDFYVWLSDGLYPLDDNPPFQAIGHFHIPYDSILWDTSYTVVETWEQGIVFNPGEKFHIGYAHAYTPGDSLLVLSDDGANNSNRSVEWHVTPDTGWGTILDDWGYGVDFFINAMICPYPPYVCGDCNGDGVISAADVVYLINYLFIRGPGPDPLCTGDVNADGLVNVTDVVYLINYLFIYGPAPSPDCCSGKKIEKDSPQIRSAPGKLPKSPGDLERIK